MPVKSLKIISDEIPLSPGGSRRLRCRVTPENATRRGVIWESGDPAVAIIDKFGVVNALKKGEVEIRAYSWDDARPLAANTDEQYRRDGISDSIRIRVEQ